MASGIHATVGVGPDIRARDHIAERVVAGIYTSENKRQTVTRSKQRVNTFTTYPETLV